MKFDTLHAWDLDTTSAAALQRELASRVDCSRPVDRYTLVAGADISYNRRSPTLYAGVVVLRADDWSVVERQGVVSEATFPYIPGYLSFRESPPVLEAFARLNSEPDVIMVDGQGLAHPRGLGLACHLGLWLQRPCVGYAKSRLIGEYQQPSIERGSTSDLTYQGKRVGMVVRSRDRVKPLFVSPGHRIDLESSVRLVLASSRGYRQPEPTRQAHLFVNELRAGSAC